MRGEMESSGRGHRDGVEITSIGVLYHGPYEKKYWSSSRGKEKYPYPIGYQATRWHGGHCYFMEVLEGPRGPSFVVKCEEGITCSGQTPSVAWDDILKKKHAGAKRVLIRSSSTSIDGAEMFGFTNPLVQRLCRDLVVSASGAAENSHSLPDEEVKEYKEDAAEGARRKAASLSESSEKSPVKARRGKKSIQSPSTKNVGEGAEEKEKKGKQRLASQLVEEEQEIKETRKQKLKRPATESLERSQDVKVAERTQLHSTGKDREDHPQEEEMPRSKRSKLPKPKVGPHAGQDKEHVDASQTVSSANSKRVKSLPLGTKRLKGEDRSDGQMSKDSGHGTRGVSPQGASDGDRQKDTVTPFVKDTQESAGADYKSEVPVTRITASSPSEITCASDRSNVDEASRNANSRKKRMKLAKSQKILDSVKPEKYDTEVDLTQSEGFLSIDLMCPSAEDMRKQTSEAPSSNKLEDVSSKQDGYLMLLAACKVAEVEQKNIPKEKSGAADVKRKRPISDVDSVANAAKPAEEVVSFPSSSKETLLSVGDVVGVNELASSSASRLEDESSRNLAPPGENFETYSTSGKVNPSDVSVSLETSRGNELLTVVQSKEDTISCENLENMDVSDGAGKMLQVLHNSNSEGKVERYLDKTVVKKGEHGSSRYIPEESIRPDHVHGNNAQTIGRVNSSLKSPDLAVENLSFHEQVSKDLEATGSRIHQKDATQGDEGLKVSDEAKLVLKVSSPLENGGNDSSQSGKLTDGSATCTVVSSDAVLREESVSDCDSDIQNSIDHSGQVDPHRVISAAREGAFSRQALESVAVAKAVENINSLQPKCVAEMNLLGTTCDSHIPAGAPVNDLPVRHEDLQCKELQDARNLATAASEKQETSLPNTSVSQSSPEEINQPVHSAEVVEGTPAVIKMGCSQQDAGEPCSTVVKVNRIKTGAVENSPEQLLLELQPAHSVTEMMEMKPDLYVSSQGLDQHSGVTLLDTNHQVDVDTPMASLSQANFASALQREESPPKSLKQPFESVSAFVQPTSAVCFGVGFTKLENGSNKSEKENGMVNGAPLKIDMNLPIDFAADLPSTNTSLGGSSQAVDLGAQSKALQDCSSKADMGISSVVVDRMEFDLCVPAHAFIQNTTHELLPAQVGPVEGTDSLFEPNSDNCSRSRDDTVFTSNQGVDLTSSTLSRKEAQVPALDVSGCKEAVDNPETHREVSSYTALDIQMLSSVMRGADGRTKEDQIKELVPATVEAVKDSGSGAAKFENGNVSDNVSAVLMSKEMVLVPICTVSQEQVSDSKGCTEIADFPNKHADIIKTAQIDVVSLDPSVDKTDFDLTDTGVPIAMEKLTPAPAEVEKEIGLSAELALGKAREPDVPTVCGQSGKVRSSEDNPFQEDRGSKVFDLEGGVENAESTGLVNHQAGSVSNKCRGDEEEQKPGAIADCEFLVQDKGQTPALFPDSLDAGKSSSSQIVNLENVQVHEPEEIKQPAFISGNEQSTNHATSSVTTGLSEDVVLEEEHVQVDACTISSSDVLLVEAVSPVPSQISALSEIQSQRSESDSAGRELTTSMMTLLLPEALPFVANRKRVERKDMTIVGDDVPSKTGDIDVGASVSLVGSGYHPSTHPGAQADLSHRILEAGRVTSGELVLCNASGTVGFEQQLKAGNGPGNDGVSSVQASNAGCMMEIDPEVHAGNQVSSSNGNVQEHTLSSEVSPPQANISNGIAANLEVVKPYEFCAETSNTVTMKGTWNKSKHLSQEFRHCDTLSESADSEMSQPLSAGTLDSDLCRDDPEVSIQNVMRDDVGGEHLSSCVTSLISPLDDIVTQESVEVTEMQLSPNDGLRTSRDTSSSIGAAQVQREAQLCTKVVEMDPNEKSTGTTAVRRVELAKEQSAGCNRSLTAALETTDNQDSASVVSSQSVLGVAVITSSNDRVEDEVSLVKHAEAQIVDRIHHRIEDVREYLGEGFKRCGDLMLDDTAPPVNLASEKLDTTSVCFQDAVSRLLRVDASCGYRHHSEVNLSSAAVRDLSEKVNHAEPESCLCPQPSLSPTHIDESVKIQSSHFQKMELPVSIEHPTKVSTMVVHVRGEEIRLCVSCGTGSQRTLSVFKVVYTEGALLEHQLVTVVETSYKNQYGEEEEMKLVSEESGLSFTPDGQQLILLNCFELRNSRRTDTHDGDGVNIISLEEPLSPTRLESERTLLCLAVQEPQRLIVAGEDGHINFWDMDPSWRSFEKKVSLPTATLDGVPFTSVTSLSVVPHLQHMIVGCNPSGFFALWDLNRETLLYSCQMLDNLVLKTSLVDLKSMDWEQPVIPEESGNKDSPERSACKATEESLTALPLICLLTMVSSKEKIILENKEDVLSFKEQTSRASEEQPSARAEVNPRGIDTDLVNPCDRSSDSNGSTPQHQPVDTRNFEGLELQEQDSGDEMRKLTSTDPSKSDKKNPRKIPGPWDCKTVVMRGGQIVCGHALSDRPTSITSMGRYGVMGTADGLVHLWDVENGRKLVQLDDLQGSAVVSLATSSSLAVLATAGENKRVNLYLQKDVFAEAIKKNVMNAKYAPVFSGSSLLAT